MHKGEHRRPFVNDNFKKGSLRRSLRITKLTSLVCPLCGRHVALSIFDPSRFEPDIFAVNVKGLGYGRGFAISETFSVLGDQEITDLIAERCRKILGLIEGKVVPTSKEVSALKKEVVSIEGHLSYWRNETLKLRMAQKKDEAELGGMEDEVSYWRRLAKNLKEEVTQLETTVGELKENATEGEMLCLEEMDELLEKINTSTNEDFEYLADAIEYLLEGQ